jgi:hypothetical protein
MKNYLMIIQNSDENTIQCYYVNSEQKKLIQEIPSLKDVLAMNDIYITFIKPTKIKDLTKAKSEKIYNLISEDSWTINNYKISNNQKSIIDFLNNHYKKIFQEWNFSITIE